MSDIGFKMLRRHIKGYADDPSCRACLEGLKTQPHLLCQRPVLPPATDAIACKYGIDELPKNSLVFLPHNLLGDVRFAFHWSASSLSERPMLGRLSHLNTSLVSPTVHIMALSSRDIHNFSPAVIGS